MSRSVNGRAVGLASAGAFEPRAWVNGAVVGAGFLPTALAGLAWWFRADLGVTLNGATVSAWADQSGNARHLTQATGARQPALVATDAAYDGRASLSFDGGDCLDSAYLGPQAQPITQYVVGHIAVPGATGVFTDAVGFPETALYTSAGAAALYTTLGAPLVSAATVHAPCVMCGVFNGASSAVYVTDHSTAAATGSPGAPALSTSLRVGSTPAYLAGLVGFIAEVIAYSGAHDAATRSRVMGYLRARYAL